MWSDFPQKANSVLWAIMRADFLFYSADIPPHDVTFTNPCCAPGRNAFYVCSSLSPAAFHHMHGSKCHISIHHLVFIAHTGCCQSAIKQQRFTIAIVWIVDRKFCGGLSNLAGLLLLYCGQGGSPRPYSFSVSAPLIEQLYALTELSITQQTWCGSPCFTFIYFQIFLRYPTWLW